MTSGFDFQAVFLSKASAKKTKEDRNVSAKPLRVLSYGILHYRKRGSASYCAWGTFGEREREIQRERRKWRHHCRAKIGDEFTLSRQNFAQLAMSLHFPLPKIRTFRFSLHREVTIVAMKFAMSSHFPLPKFCSPSLFPLFQMARAARRVIENPRQRIKSCPVLFVFPIEKMNQINTKNYWK